MVEVHRRDDRSVEAAHPWSLAKGRVELWSTLRIELENYFLRQDILGSLVGSAEKPVLQ